MLLEGLYAGKGLPASTKPGRARQVLRHLHVLLARECLKKHVWLATATRAVEPGQYRGERLRKRRLKLLRLLNEVREFLGEEPVILPEGWASFNLYYGYGAITKWRERTGASLNAAIFAGFFVLGPGGINDGGGLESPAAIEVTEEIAADFLNRDRFIDSSQGEKGA